MSAPRISALRAEGTNLVVEVSVPAGLRRVSLQARRRVGSGAWTPVAIGRLDGNGGHLQFTVPNRADAGLLRVLAEDTEPLPTGFYGDTNGFAGTVSASNLGTRYAGGTTTGMTPGAVDDSANGGTGSGTPRTVAESDIWKVSGDRIYFFNTLRGLQVMDISTPDAPTLRGTFVLPGAGEQMYLVAPDTVALLVQAGCYVGTQQSQVILLSTADPDPTVLARLPVDGYITESRMVGSALYVASQTYQETVVKGVHTYESGSLLTSFDLSDPAHPAVRGRLWFSGYNNVVAATDVLFFIVTQDPADWTRSSIHAVDITAPDGSMADYQTVHPLGMVADKFKMDYTGTRFTCVSQEAQGARRTFLETYLLADPRSASKVSLKKLGELVLTKGESLFATRFDGDRVYVVTFQRIDPLFIVDLSDPAAPRTVGELQVPGWSTYIQPLGDRIVAVGSESNRVAVSLFDVANPAKPALLSRVRLGDSYSWSEGAWNEKAVTILPEDHTILLPYSGDSTNGWASRVQLIDLDRDKLTARGVVERAMQPRRAALQNRRLYAVSSRELVAVNVEDRDHPEVRSALDLSWSVDRVLVQDGHLFEFSSQGSWWGAQTLTQLRVASSARPDRALATLTLSNLPIVGVTLREGRIHVAQTEAYYFFWGGPIRLAADTTVDPPAPSGLLTVIDVRDPLAPKVEGQVAAPLPQGLWGQAWQPLWVRPDVLVWYTRGTFHGYFPWLAAVDMAMPVGGAWYWGGQSPALVAVDVADPTAPRVRSTITLGGDSWWGVGEAYVQDSLVYLSHLESQALPPPGPVDLVKDPGWVPDRWLQTDQLSVVDYADPGSPEVRDPLDLPGPLQGIARRGELLYCAGRVLDDQGNITGGSRLDALAYDGVQVHRVDSVLLDKSFTLVGRVEGDAFIAGLPVVADATGVQTGRLDTWQVDPRGKLQRTGTLALPGAPGELVAGQGALVVLRDATGVVRLLDASDPSALKVAGSSLPGGCYWSDPALGDGSLGLGYWLPLGDYGLQYVPVGADSVQP